MPSARSSFRPGGCFDLDATAVKIAELDAKTQDQNFWNDAAIAQRVSKRLGELRESYNVWLAVRDEADQLREFAELAIAENDAAAHDEAKAQFEALLKRFEKMEMATLLDEPHDASDAIIAIHAGAGGTEAQDWAEMLLRMYFRYAERRGWTVKLLDESRGGEAGIKSATFSVEGRNAYGFLKCEAGVHRLVRISPFDAEKMRHTSFALVEALPDLGDVEELEIDAKDLRIDTYLAGGHGGQGVQTTYSAVRITHLPTGIVVTCQNERSQTQNKATAMRILRAKIHAVTLRKREEEKQKLRGEFTSAEWGNQIRSYVLHPYKLVKDHRTKFETQDAAGVLEGDLDAFIDAYLKFRKEK